MSRTITEKKNSDWPMVVHVTDLFHISKATCKRGRDGARLTNCGRALTHSTSATKLPDVDPTKTRWALCSRCGSRDDFEATVAQHQANLHELMERWEKEEKAKRRIEAEASQAKLDVFLQTFLGAYGSNVKQAGPYQIIVDISGQLFAIKAVD